MHIFLFHPVVHLPLGSTEEVMAVNRVEGLIASRLQMMVNLWPANMWLPHFSVIDGLQSLSKSPPDECLKAYSVFMKLFKAKVHNPIRATAVLSIVTQLSYIDLRAF